MSVFTDIHELIYFAKLKIFLISASKKTNQNKKYFFYDISIFVFI